MKSFRTKSSSQAERGMKEILNLHNISIGDWGFRMVRCRLCGKKVVLKRIEEREEEEEKPTGSYYKKPQNLYGFRQSGGKATKVKIYGCSDPNCLSSEMTEQEYLEQKEDQSHGL
jgi:hypothetical protein